jgi:hypothetical protein
LIDEINILWSLSRKAFNQLRIFNHVRELSYGAITALGRRSIAGVITACGKQFTDWSSTYRIFRDKRIRIEVLFDVIRGRVMEELEPEQMILAHMDDTIIKKTGKKVSGTAWRRDPLGPAFHTNFIWGQRFLQVSMALPSQKENCQSRAIPIDFHHCPTVKKLPRQANAEQIKTYKEEQRIAKLSKQGSLRIKALRDKLDMDGAQERELTLSVDGSYTNATVLKSLPERVTLIGRIRKDAKLHQLPEEQPLKGRKKVYGEPIQTPEQIRQDETIPWQEVRAFAAQKSHVFDIKVVKHVKWRAGGERHTFQLIVIRPLAYRLTKESGLLYRQPAYIICTDVEMDITKLLQAYLWRWEIEVNLRDEKTDYGCGQSQVRHPESVKNFPAFMVAIYSFVHLAAHRCCKSRDESILPRPSWYNANTTQRLTTSEIINLFRAQHWFKNAAGNFSGFIKNIHKMKSLKNNTNPLLAAVLYARK